MTRDRERELRAAGVLDGSALDLARIVFLDIYECARFRNRRSAPTAEALIAEVTFAAGFSGSERQRGVKLAAREMRRGSLRDGRRDMRDPHRAERDF